MKKDEEETFWTCMIYISFFGHTGHYIKAFFYIVYIKWLFVPSASASASSLLVSCPSFMFMSMSIPMGFFNLYAFILEDEREEKRASERANMYLIFFSFSFFYWLFIP